MINIKKISKNLILEDTIEDDDKLTLVCKSTLDKLECPICHTLSRQKHSVYPKSFQALPINKKACFIAINNRVMKCINKDCEVTRFSETYDFIEPFAKYTNDLIEHMLKLLETNSTRKVCEILNEEGVIIGKSVVSKIQIKYRK